MCVCVFFPFILDIKFVGRTSRGHTGGKPPRIFHPPSFCVDERKKSTIIVMGVEHNGTVMVKKLSMNCESWRSKLFGLQYSIV